MANDKRFVVKNGLQTQNINFESPDKTKNTTISLLDNGNISFNANNTQVFTVTNIGIIGVGTWNANTISSTYGGTGVNNAGRTITIGGNVNTANSFTTVGNFATTLTTTGATDITLPTSGTLLTSAGSYADPTWITSLAKSKVGLANVENTALSTWAGSANVITIGAATASSLIVTGNLTISGTTTTVNSTTVTIDDPIFTLGGDTAPTIDDNKDRGVEFKWHNGTVAKVGFFGYDDSTSKFTFIPDATNTSEVFSGTKGTLDANIEWADVLNKPDPNITVTLTGDVTGTANTTLTDLANGTISIATTSVNVANGVYTTGNQAIGGIKTFTANTIFNDRVGIGTTAPLASLHLNAASTAVAIRLSVADVSYGNLFASASGVALNNITASALTFGTTNTERMRIDATGNVGIGTVAPSQKLEVAGNIYINDVDGQGIIFNGGNGIFRASANSMAIHANSAERMRVSANGNVGIGTTAPTQKLEVVGSIYLNNLDTEGIIMNGGNAINRASLGIQIRTNNADAVRIDSTGRVGIGINLPTAKLHVVGTALVTDELQAKVINSTNGIMLNSRVISGSYTITANNNAMSAGPIEIASGVIVTVLDGARWVVM